MKRPPSRFHDVVLAVHGGAGVITREHMPPYLERQVLKALERALKVGHEQLAKGRGCLDAVGRAVMVLEDSPHFNAGRGATFNHNGKIEHDASIMDGSNKACGAVSAVRRIKNPICAARKVMECTRHILLVGAAADRFAQRMGLTMVDPAYFWTKRRWEQLQEARRKERGQPKPCPDKRFGTVGAVAVDRLGNIAAATSTGGLTNKMAGRVGDSAIIGAGTYADNATCAVSTTGHGESFMRQVVAYDLGARMRYQAMCLHDAAESIIHGSFKDAGGEGGLIAIDADGNCSLEFNSEGMYRGCITSRGKMHIAIYR